MRSYRPRENFDFSCGPYKLFMLLTGLFGKGFLWYYFDALGNFIKIADISYCCFIFAPFFLGWGYKS